MRSISCSRCRGQCYAESDGDEGVQLTCLQCSRVFHHFKNEREAGDLGMAGDAWDRFAEQDWSCLVWDDGEPAIFFDEEEVEYGAA